MFTDIISVSLDLKNQKIKADFEEIISSLPQFRLHDLKDKSGCDLLILEIGRDIEKEFQYIHSVQTSGMVKEIFLTSSCLEPDLLIRALRAGVKEFIPQPLEKGEARNTLLRFVELIRHSGFSGKKILKKGKIINLIGSKGGVGTTTVAVNLATTLCRSSSEPISVVLIDMNLLFG